MKGYFGWMSSSDELDDDPLAAMELHAADLDAHGKHFVGDAGRLEDLKGSAD